MLDVPEARFISGVHVDLRRKPFLHFNTGSVGDIISIRLTARWCTATQTANSRMQTAGNTGHVGLMCHKQPTLEKHLRSVISASSCSCLRNNCTLTSISEDEDWVYAKYLDSAGVERQIRSKFLVGADGKTGYTRKKYLEPQGVQMQWAGQ